MGVRYATQDDLHDVLEMALAFADAAPFPNLVNKQKVSLIVGALIAGKMILIDNELQGFLAFTINPFTYGSDNVATELAWWVNPEARKKSVGKELLERFEEVSKEAGCKAVVVSCLADEVGKFYEKCGYKLHEQAYMKELA